MTIVVSQNIGWFGSQTTRQNVSSPLNPGSGVYVAQRPKMEPDPDEGLAHNDIEVAGAVNVVSESAHTVNVLSSGIVTRIVSMTGRTVITTSAVSHKEGIPLSQM